MTGNADAQRCKLSQTPKSLSELGASEAAICNFRQQLIGRQFFALVENETTRAGLSEDPAQNDLASNFYGSRPNRILV